MKIGHNLLLGELLTFYFAFEMTFFQWFSRLMVGEKVDQLELMSLQKQLKSWELEKYYSTALIVMVIMTPSSLKNICFMLLLNANFYLKNSLGNGNKDFFFHHLWKFSPKVIWCGYQSKLTGLPLWDAWWLWIKLMQDFNFQPIFWKWFNCFLLF